MNTEIDIKNRSMHLHSAILLYGNGDHVYYATRHAVQQSPDGAPVILPGSPISEENLYDAYSELIGETSLQMLDKNTLAFNVNTLVFWSPPKVRHVRFICPEPMGSASGYAPHPGLIFVWKKHELSVFAVKGRKKPSLSTQIFHAPYMNLFEDGDMCLGNVVLPKPEPCNVPACEAAFFQSYFTHANTSKQVNYPGGIYSLWIDLLKPEGDGSSVFPEEVLVPKTPVNGKKYTVADLLAGG